MACGDGAHCAAFTVIFSILLDIVLAVSLCVINAEIMRYKYSKRMSTKSNIVLYNNNNYYNKALNPSYLQFVCSAFDFDA